MRQEIRKECCLEDLRRAKVLLEQAGPVGHGPDPGCIHHNGGPEEGFHHRCSLFHQQVLPGKATPGDFEQVERLGELVCLQLVDDLDEIVEG